ncbi:MAG: hypothetical protein D8M57_00415 [Candidatus Scalindua sp. AMX11]|nr:MAG: hypothetical protein DWQ00_18570 [Candidatus Scalindua sp.]NOG86164.1 hypothetical protein [Planctomycetota bacterium]RZV98923.1 MAG: hypothetical protein EX341_00495 [Candidatus Scalindua sp. SCAELEC01]TDE66885.1 MAG: hypothetical protein D8M57_00415 [Candidatus Scalindua sp. AMX11]GJQ57687.1 MAG: hypothetical protein SCALA701_04880 [Candidatus Scalindua sp.]
MKARGKLEIVRWIFFFVVSVCVSSSIGSVQAGPGLKDLRLDSGNTSGNGDSWESQISSDGNGNVYVVWEDDRNGPPNIYFNHSEDYGMTWQASDTRLDTGNALGLDGSYDPQISSDDTGHVYVTWEDSLNGGYEKRDIYFNYSEDYGATWQRSDIRLDTGDAPGANHSFGSQISSDSNGHVYVTWQDSRNGGHKSPDTYLNNKGDIYFNYSEDYGATWQTSDIRLDTGDAPGVNGSYAPEMSSDGNGHVYVTWHDDRNGEYCADIYFNYSEDYGATWQTRDIRLDTGDAPGANHSFWPQISSDGNGHVYVAWQDNRNDNHDNDFYKDDIYFNYSDDYGVTWQTNDIRLDTGDAPGADGSFGPQISSDGNGRVYVVWVDYRNGEYIGDIYFNYSKDYGETWQTIDIRLDTDHESNANGSSGPQISSDGNGHVYVTWEDNRNETFPFFDVKSDIYFNYSEDYGETWQTSNIRLDTGDVSGANGLYSPQISNDGNGHVYVTWQDYRNEFSDIYINYSGDYGVTWQTNDIRLDTDTLIKRLGYSSDAQISSDGKGHVYVTWEDDRNGSGDIYFNYSEDYGETWQASDIRLDTGDLPGAYGSYNPQISSDGNGHAYVTWNDYRNGSSDIYFNYSEDYGETWQASDIRLDTGDTPGANYSFGLQISSDGNGHVYVTWHDSRNGGHNIYFNYSEDYGETWQASDIRLDTGGAPEANGSYDSQISSDGDGHVYVTWRDYRNGSSDIYFNYSDDYGVMWQASDIRLDTGAVPGANSSIPPQISSDSNGHVYVTWHDSRNGGRDIYFNYSDDYGETWQTSDIRLDRGDTPGEYGSYNPQISSDDEGHVYVTWQDSRNGEYIGDIYFNYSDIYFNYSEDYGATWQASDIKLDTSDAPGANGSYAYVPRISSDGNGHVYVTWQDMRNARYFYNTIYFNYFFVDERANVNDFLKVSSIKGTYHWSSDTTDCPDGFVGKLMFDVKIKNTSNKLLSDLAIQVEELAGGNILKVSEEELGSEGVLLTLPLKDNYSDGELCPGEVVIVPLVICLKEWKPFELFIDVLGKPGS